MTIEKGAEWGFVVDEWAGGIAPTGDLAREIGIAVREDADASKHAGPWRRLPLDTLVVSLTTRESGVVQHETSGWLRVGSRYRGDFCIVSSLSFVDGRRLFSRSHPNDGRFEWLCLSRKMPVRQRISFWRRTHTETHLPHPLARTGSGTTFDLMFTRPVRATFSDGVVFERVMEIRVNIQPDSTHTHIPAQ